MNDDDKTNPIEKESGTVVDFTQEDIDRDSEPMDKKDGEG